MAHRQSNSPEAEPLSELDVLEAATYRESFYDFMVAFWDCVPGSQPLVLNWHMKVLCDEMQAMAERVFVGLPAEYDLLMNISPGTSKSTICSILFQPWTWTRMPTARHILASHTDTLVLDLATKARSVIESEKYQKFFPEIKIKHDQDTKSYFSNTLGGDRFSCTVGGKSPLGFHGHFVGFDDPLDPQKALSAAELLKAGEFKTTTLETRKVDKVVSAFFGIMQRVHSMDPTGVAIEKAKAEGSKPLRLVCLPAMIDGDKDNVNPPELKVHYKDGLMDPVRLSKKVLDTFLANMGAYAFAGQFMQTPVSLSGGLFKLHYFNNRVKAAPYDCTRIRYWDRAASQNKGCLTAGVLIGKDKDGLYYVEHVVAGQWEPVERNKIMKATALRDRNKYGANQPVIAVEAEGGSSGRDAWLGVVKALDGFYVKEDKVTGSKETRAEPWSTQLAAGSVRLVEDGTWNIHRYIENHCLFPLGQFLDEIDASTGAYNLLVNRKHAGTLYIRPLNRKKKGQLMIAVCTREELPSVPLENKPYALISVIDPMRATSLGEVLETMNVSFAERELISTAPDRMECRFADLQPEDYQDRWDEPVEEYGRKIEDLVMTRDDGKAVWKFLTKPRDTTPEILVIVDDGGRALSLACGITDTLRLPRSIIFQAGDPESKNEGPPPNQYVFATIKNSRGLICT